MISRTKKFTPIESFYLQKELNKKFWNDKMELVPEVRGNPIKIATDIIDRIPEDIMLLSQSEQGIPQVKYILEPRRDTPIRRALNISFLSVCVLPRNIFQELLIFLVIGHQYLLEKSYIR